MPVEVHGERVDAECVGEQVECLAVVPNAVCSAEPKCVVEVTVDGFGVVASRVEAREVGVAGWDGSDVFGAVEAAFLVVVVAVKVDGKHTVAVVDWKLVVVVPAVGTGFGSGAVGANPFKGHEDRFAVVGDFGDPNLATFGEDLEIACACWRGDSFGFDVGGLFDASFGFVVLVSDPGVGGDTVDGEQSEVA